MAGQPAAFMSYARFDDQHDDGQLTVFRERLAAEVRMQTGEEFLIFPDRADIAWGQNWQQRIGQALDTVTLLLAIITPGFFRSPYCRAETEQFLDRERQLGRDDLILPVYYVSTPEVDDPGRRDADPLAATLAARQYADWRELRFEPATSPVARRAMALLATRIRDTFWRPPASAPVPARTAPADPAGASARTASVDPARSAARTETAQPADRILVRPAPIFIVHGSDTLRAESVAHTVSTATGRKTIILRDEPNLGRTLVEKFEQHAAEVSYAIIILTPDDIGCRADESDTRPRGRQNVVFEMGYFFGLIGRRNVSVLLRPGVEKPSDMDGIAYITFDDNRAWKTELFRELKHAGFDIDL